MLITVVLVQTKDRALAECSGQKAEHGTLRRLQNIKENDSP